MGNVLVVNAAPEQTRVALLENATAVEFMFERRRDRGVVGNIYKGRVQRVLPGMQAAFVDISLDKAAFLYVGDLVWGQREIEDTQEVNLAQERESTEIIQLRNGPERGRIEEQLHVGQELLVQVAKEAIGTKGARITAHISLPGRHLVYMPTVDHVGISRRITDVAERERLREIIERLRPPHAGFVVRTAAEGVPEQKIATDMEFLISLWNDVHQRAASMRPPALVHPDLDVVLRATRDLFTAEIDRLIVDDEATYQRVVDFVQGFAPGLLESIEHYDRPRPIFEAFGVEVELSRAMSRKVWLKSGGYIVWDEAEALTVIDVNTGRYVGKHNLEDTITRTNLEAVQEICYQLRLRNVGGVVVIDFIDMEEPSNREKVLETLRATLKRDRARTHVVGMSELGLVEITRQRVRESLLRSLAETCPYCEGRGSVLSKRSVAYEIFGALRQQAKSMKNGTVVVSCRPEVASHIYDHEADLLEALEDEIGRRVVIRGQVHLHQEKFEISQEGS